MHWYTNAHTHTHICTGTHALITHGKKCPNITSFSCGVTNPKNSKINLYSVSNILKSEISSNVEILQFFCACMCSKLLLKFSQLLEMDDFCVSESVPGCGCWDVLQRGFQGANPQVDSAVLELPGRSASLPGLADWCWDCLA